MQGKVEVHKEREVRALKSFTPRTVRTNSYRNLFGKNLNYSKQLMFVINDIILLLWL